MCCDHVRDLPLRVKALIQFLQVALACTVAPITRTVLRVTTTISPQFYWRDQSHGQALRWLLRVEDSDTEVIYHHEMWTLTRKMMQVRPRAVFAWPCL